MKSKLKNPPQKQARVVELYITKERRIPYYGIKIGDSYGCDRAGTMICSPDLNYVKSMAFKFNKRSPS